MPRAPPPRAAGPAGAAAKARGPPAVHHLYVLVVGSGAAQNAKDQKSRELTLAILTYVSDRLPIFTEMGVKVTVHKISKGDLAKPALIQAMKRRGITSLPALVTPNDTYVGNRAIGDVYEANIKEFRAFQRRGEDAPPGIAAEDELDQFYQDEMSFSKAAAESGIGDGDDIGGESSVNMDAYRAAMARRSEGPPSSARHISPPGRPAAAVASRQNNVSGGSSDDTMDSLIQQMAGTIDQQTFENAFASSGGDSLDLEGESMNGNAQDDVMEQAYWANQEASM